MPDPLATALRPGPPARAAEVAAALARSLAPPEAAADPPAWLWPEQVAAFRRAVAAVRRYGGALLADPVGTGKTYIALAVAAALEPRRPAVCLVPASLAAQWRAVAGRLGVAAIVWTHERVSRGRLPPGGWGGMCGEAGVAGDEPRCGNRETARSRSGGLVIVDESHHYRNPETRRYSTLARWLPGRRALLLSATPVVNRLVDLAHQLRLAVRDDALGPHGVPSLLGLLSSGHGHSALGCLVLCGRSAAGRRPETRCRRIAWGDGDLGPVAGVLELAERLRLSTSAPIAALIRGALWRAAASSPAALVASLRRYRRLLLHARDALRAGRAPDRRALLRLTEGLGDQLLLWELLQVEAGAAVAQGAEGARPPHAAGAGPPRAAEGGGPPRGAAIAGELALEDLELVDRLVAAAEAAAELPDPKLERLRGLLADGRRSLVFVTSRATARHLRDRLDGSVAWCTGDRAGIGRWPAPREAVLDWFREVTPPACDRARFAPLHLVATDVAAEGLDLRGAERVVHYDLPWTPMRLEQREGRTLRAGSRHPDVELVRFDPPPVVEARLRQLEALALKGRLPAAAGLGDGGRSLWSWRTDLADRFQGRKATAGVAGAALEPRGVLAGFALHRWPAQPGGGPLAAWVLWWTEAEGWTDHPEIVAARLAAAAGAADAAIAPGAVESALRALADPIRTRVQLLRGTGWLSPMPAPAARRVLARIQRLVHQAARRRDAALLDRLHRAARFAAGGHTAGEARRLEELAALDDPAFRAALAGLPEPSPACDAIEPRLTGLIVFAGAG